MTLRFVGGEPAFGNGLALPVRVLRDADWRKGDRTAGGISSLCTRLLVVGETLQGVLDLAERERLLAAGASANYPGAAIAHLVPGIVPGTARIVPHMEGRAATAWCMFGGNFAHCGDPRFLAAVQAITGAPFDGAVPIHDRIEG